MTYTIEYRVFPLTHKHRYAESDGSHISAEREDYLLR